MVQNYPQYFACIRYHAWWPSSGDPYYTYNTSENRARIQYYPPHPDGYYYTPYAWIDGIIRGGYSYSSWWAFISGRYEEPSPLEITLSGGFDDVLLSGTLNMRIVATGSVDLQNLKVRIALTESNINWRAPNNTTIHNQTMRDMIPTAAGTAITIQEGDTVSLSQAFSCPNPLVWQNCELVVFVQSDATREVLQSAKIKVVDLRQSPVRELPQTPTGYYLAQNYPNPFNSRTVIEYQLGEPSAMSLDIYDLAGRKVTTLRDGFEEAGRHQVIWDGTDSQGKPVGSGIYFYRLEVADKAFTNRMILIK